jgi:lysozyme
MEIKKMDKAGIDALIFEEGLKLKPYRDKAGVPTIGIGMTYYPETGKRVSMADKPLAGKAEALRQFYMILKPYETTVWSATRDDITQNQFNALTLTCYNIGQKHFKDSTLLKRVNANPLDFPGIEEAFEMWRYSDGEPILLERRKREFKIYIS